MFAARIISLLGASVAAIDFAKLDTAGDDASLHCFDGNTFCQRTREFKLDQQAGAGDDLAYHIIPDTIKILDDVS